MLGTPPQEGSSSTILTYTFIKKSIYLDYSVIPAEVYNFFYKDLDISVFIRIFTL